MFYVFVMNSLGAILCIKYKGIIMRPLFNTSCLKVELVEKMFSRRGKTVLEVSKAQPGRVD